MKYEIIGISGPARVGKDTAADFIRGKMPIYEIASFADPIKEMLRVGLGLTASQLYGQDKQKVDDRYGCTPRKLMQTLGTEWGREMIDQNIWVNAMKAHIELYDDPHFIIPDVRFESEADMIREKGILIHIHGMNVIDNAHISEQGVKLNREDIIVNNNGTLDEYYLKLDKMLRKRLK